MGPTNPVRMVRWLVATGALFALSLALLAGCGAGRNKPVQAEIPNRPPFIPTGAIELRPAVVGIEVDDGCGNLVQAVPAVRVSYDVIDVEDLCGGGYFFYSVNGGLTFRPATESTYRPPGMTSPDCATNPVADYCNPCLPDVPSGSSSAGAAVPEPDNHAAPICMSARTGGQTNRFYWDIFADAVGFPTPTSAIFCISVTDPSNPLPPDLAALNRAALEGGTGQAAEIPFSELFDNLRDNPRTPGFFCSDTLSISAPLTFIGVDSTGISEIRVGSTGAPLNVPIRIRNQNSGGPTCFFVGIAYTPSHLNFSYFSSSAFTSGTPATSADLVQPTAFLTAQGGTATLVAPAPGSMTGDEDFVVVQVTSPIPLVGGNLFELLFLAQPPAVSGGPNPQAVVTFIETIPVGGDACRADPASCPTRNDWEVPTAEYRGTTSVGLGGDPCAGVRYPFVPEPPAAITCVENFEPECCIRPVTGEDVRGSGLALTYYLMDRDTDPITIAPEYSVDGGVTWLPMTERITDPLTEGTVGLASAAGDPCPAAPGPGDEPCGIGTCPDDFLGAIRHVFVWDQTVDLPAGTGFLCDIQARITPYDGASYGDGCIEQVPYLFAGAPGLVVRRRDDPAYQVNNVISTQAGGRPVILPQMPDSDHVSVFAVGLNGEEIDVTESVTFTSSDPDVIDVTFDAGSVPPAALVENDPGGLTPGIQPRCLIGNQCVQVDLTFAGFTAPPFAGCPVAFFDPGGGLPPAQLSGQFAACTDLGGPDYAGVRAPYMATGDVDADIPGLPSGAPIVGAGATVDVALWIDMETQDLGAYSLELEWSPTSLTFVDIFPGPSLPNLTANTSQAGQMPLALVAWNNFTTNSGLTGVVEIETFRFQVACAPGLCATPFTIRLNTLVDQGGATVGSFVGGAADSGTDCSAEFTVP